MPDLDSPILQLLSFKRNPLLLDMSDEQLSELIIKLRTTPTKPTTTKRTTTKQPKPPAN